MAIGAILLTGRTKALGLCDIGANADPRPCCSPAGGGNRLTGRTAGLGARAKLFPPATQGRPSLAFDHGLAGRLTKIFNKNPQRAMDPPSFSLSASRAAALNSALYAFSRNFLLPNKKTEPLSPTDPWAQAGPSSADLRREGARPCPSQEMEEGVMQGQANGARFVPVLASVLALTVPAVFEH